MKTILNRAFPLLLAALLVFTTLYAQVQHAPVTAGSRAQQPTRNPHNDSVRYEEARQRDRENIKRILQEKRENNAAPNSNKNELRTRKLLAKGAIYVVLGAIALVVYIRKKKKAEQADRGHKEV